MSSSSSNRGRRRSRTGASAGRGNGRGSADESDTSSQNRGVGDGRAQTPSSPRGGDRGRRLGFNRSRGGQPRGRVLRGSGILTSPRQPATDIGVGVSDDSGNAHMGIPRVVLPTGFQRDNLPLRPGFGTGGREIKLRTNFFPVRVPRGPLYNYNVAVSPVTGLRFVTRRILHLAEQTTAWNQAGMRGKVAHDGSERLISTIRLPQPLTIAVPYYPEEESGPPAYGGRVYTVSIVFVMELDASNLESYLTGEPHHRNDDVLPVIAALNIILTSITERTDVMVRRKRYFSPFMAEPFRLGGGLETWKGFYPTLSPVYKQLMVRVSICTTTFRTPGNLARAMIEFRNSSFDARMDVFSRHVRIKTTRLGLRRIINRVVSHTARAYTIDTPEYGHVTMEDYFRQKYNIRLQYPNLPLVDIGVRTPIYVPAEVCEILPGQPFRRMLTNEHATSMITVACQSPNVNAAAVVHQVCNQLGLDVTRPELRSFGITIGTDMAVVPGRILPKPSIQYSSKTVPIDDKRASWNPRGVKFAVGARLDKWAVLVIKDNSSPGEFADSEDEGLHWAVARFCNVCNVSGMHVSEDPKYVTAQLPPRNPSDPFRRAAIATIRNAVLRVNPKPTMILVALANKDQAVYDSVKHLCDVSLDVATVCIQSSKLRKSDSYYLANVALKVNTKLGGINHKLDPTSRNWLNSVPTMILGICVSHPSPGSAAGTPSIAAVVASVDNDFVQYPAGLEIQEPRGEMVAELKSMVVDRLRLFLKRNSGKLPERIIVYRTGVSEGHIREVELPLILEASRVFDRPDAPYRPRLAIIICIKRHHVRFYSTSSNNDGGSGNPLPGTVVDRGITTIYGFDFFLQPHGVQQGTARPIHYHVIHDEIGFTANEVQGLTHSLSYISARTTRAVRLVCPTFYAELACRRGWCYLRGPLHGFLSRGGSEDSAEVDGMEEARRLWSGGVSRAGLKDTMFYL